MTRFPYLLEYAAIEVEYRRVAAWETIKNNSEIHCGENLPINDSVVLLHLNTAAIETSMAE